MSRDDDVKDSLEAAVRNGWLRKVGEDRYEITAEGHAKASVDLRTDPNVARVWISFFHNDRNPSELARRRVRAAMLEYGHLIDLKDLPPDWYKQLADLALISLSIYRLLTAILLEMAEHDDELAMRIAGTLDSVSDDEVEVARR